MTIQDTGGTRKTIEAGIAAIKEMLPKANDVRRETISASELILALQCGGSDGYSGITANPALGAAVRSSSTWRHGDSLGDAGVQLPSISSPAARSTARRVKML